MYGARQPAWASNIVWSSVPRDWLKFKNSVLELGIRYFGWKTFVSNREMQAIDTDSIN